MEQREWMEERIDEILDEEIFSSSSEEQEQEKKKFVIDSDIKAEWALDKIRKTHAYYDRLKRTCSDIIAKYSAILEKYARQESAECAGLEYLLMQYFDTVEHRVTETQESYKLPTGKLVMKHHAPKFDIDDAKMVSFMKANDWDGYVKIKESPNWDAFKKERCKITENGVYDSNGVKVEGIAVSTIPDTFEVVTKE
jgi:hypothetical protein